MGSDICIAYLMIGLEAPAESKLISGQVSVPKEEDSRRRASKILRVEIDEVQIEWNGNRYTGYVFLIDSGKRDDSRAQSIVDAIIGAWSLVHGPMLLDSEVMSFPFPCDLIQNDVVHVSSLEEYESKLDRSERLWASIGILALRRMSISNARMAEVWELVPYLVDEPFARAARFFAESVRNFHVYPGEVTAVLADPSAEAVSGADRSRLENALVHAFKSIEALIGEPPGDERSFRRKLEAIGVDPYLEVGYEESKTIAEEIRRMHSARDKAGAHGARRPTDLTYYDLMEFQACARLVLLSALD